VKYIKLTGIIILVMIIYPISNIISGIFLGVFYSWAGSEIFIPTDLDVFFIENLHYNLMKKGFFLLAIKVFAISTCLLAQDFEVAPIRLNFRGEPGDT